MSYIGNTPTSQSFISGTDYFNGNGSTTAFTLTRTVGSVNDIEAVVENVVQRPNDAYTLSGTTITFTSAPPSGTNNVYVRYLSTTTQSITPVQNSVSYSTMNTDLQNQWGTGFKNRIINGDMRIDQRNAGASVTPGAGGFNYTIDRFAAYVSQASKLTVQRSTTVPVGFTSSLKVTSSSAYSVLANDLFLIEQPIEGLNVSDLAWGTANAKTVTLSFQVYSSLTGTFGGSILNSSSNRSYPFTYSIASANTWTSVSVTIPGDTSGTWLTTNGIGMYVSFGIGMGSTYSGTAGAWAGAQYWSATGATSVVGTNGATWYITGVQLEVGSTATPFEVRPYGAELQLCQRYYEKTFNQSVAPANGATSTSFASGVNLVWRVDWNATFTSGTIATPTTFMVTKRAAPTITNYGNNSSQVNVLNFTAGTNTWSNATNVTITDRGFDQYSNTLGSSGQWGVVYFAYTANAEL